MTSGRRRSDAATAYVGSFFALGLVLSMLGAALTGLQAQTGATVQQISVLFLAQSAGYIIASVVAGRAFDRRSGHRLMSTSLVLVGIVMLLLPIAHTLITLIGVVFAIGLCAAAIDVGGNTLLIWSRPHRVGPMMNAMHLAFGIGALACPVLVQWSLDRSHDLWLFSIVACAVAVAMALFVQTSPAAPHPPAPLQDRARPHEADVAVPRRVLATIGLFFVFYVGMEIGFGGWIKKYAESTAPLAGSATALLTVFWAAFTFGRLLAIPAARMLSPGRILASSTTLACGAAALLVAGNGRPIPTWIATVCFGLGVAAQFPMMMAYAGERIPTTATATSWFVGGSGLGGLILPFLIGQLFGGLGAGAMPVTMLVLSVIVLGWLFLVRRTLALLDAIPNRAVAVST